MSVLWIVLIGFVAGILARLLSPGPNKPAGFILTTLLGIAGAFVATWIGATLGAVLVLFVWNRLVVARRIPDPTGERRWL